MPDRIAKARQSGEESSLREKVARIIDPHHFSMTPKDYGLKDAESFKRTMAYGAQIVALQKADAAIAVCMEEAASDDAIEAGAKALAGYDWEKCIFDHGRWRDDARTVLKAALRTLDKRMEKPGKGE